MNKDLREQWLEQAVNALRPHFKACGFTVPKNVRATCGFPSRSALPSKRQRVGECWTEDASDGKVFEIFISPVKFKAEDVFHILAHELVHATVGLKAGHKGPFKKCALGIGLEGKMTSTHPGKTFNEFAGPVLKKLGAYPHKKLNVSNQAKKCGTRLIKCECPECGYIARVTMKWIDAAGAPVCPQDSETMEVES